jgi:hypothetical protein
MPYPKKHRAPLPLSLSLDSDLHCHDPRARRRHSRPVHPPPARRTETPTPWPPLACTARLPITPQPPPACPPCLGLHLPTVPQPPFARRGLRHPGRRASASALAVRPQTSTLLSAPVLWTLLRPPLTRPLASSTPSVPRL